MSTLSGRVAFRTHRGMNGTRAVATEEAAVHVPARGRAERLLLAGALALCLLLFAGSHAAFWAATAGTFCAGWGFLALTGRARWESASWRFWVPAAALVGYPVAQSLPLPEGMLQGLSPMRASWLAHARDVAGIQHSVSSIAYVPLNTALESVLWGFLALWTWRLHRLFHLSSTHRRWFLKFFFAVVVFEAGYGLLQVLVPSLGEIGVVGAATRGIARGTFFNRNNYAAFLGLLWPVLLAHTLSLPDKRGPSRHAASRRDLRARWWERRAFFGYLTALVLLALVFSGSRAGIVCSLAAGTLFVIFSGTQRRSAAVAVVACWVLLIAYGLVMGLDQILARFDRLEGDMPGRFRLWRDTWRMIQDHPWTGVGLGNFRELFRLYQTHLPETHFARHAHSDYLQWVAELGWPAAAVGIAMLWGYWLRQAVRLWRIRLDLTPDRRMLAAGCLAGMAGFLLHSWVDFPMQMVANTMTFAAVAVLGRNGLLTNRENMRGIDGAT